MDSIPNELLLNILSCLPYFDLKIRIPLVCRRFKTLIDQRTNTGALDKALFRDAPSAQTKAHYTVHPLFWTISEMDTRPRDVQDIKYDHALKKSLTGGFPVAAIEAFSENAVSPAVPRLFLRVREYPAWEVVPKGSAVSVLDVLMAFVDVLAERDMLSDSYGYPWTRGDALFYDFYQRFHWTGIDEMRVKDGAVYLGIQGVLYKGLQFEM